MRIQPLRAVRAFAAVALIGVAASAHAALFTSLTIFGDSLSDTGNLNLATGGAQPAPGTGPYFGGRFSDGPLWVETLAQGLGLPAAAMPYLVGGGNYAFAGARTGTDSSPPGLLAQIGGIWAPMNASADPTGLYVVVAGGNDLRDARSAFTTGSAADQAGRQAAAAAAATNLFNGLALLASKGAKNVLIANLPDLGLTPEAALLGLQSASSDVSVRFNALVAGVQAQAQGLLGLDVDLLDLAGLSAAIRNDALNNGGALYGITNVSAPCAGFLFSAGASCSVSLFSDALHPSAAAHAILGRAALSAVPEPATALLAGLGVLLLAARQRRATRG